MNRRKFLGNLMKGATIAVAAPVVVGQLLKEEPWGEITHTHSAYNAELDCPAEIGWVETSQGSMWYLKSDLEAHTQFEDSLGFEMISFNRGGCGFHNIDWDILDP
jgi:hypothetical protein